MAGEPAAMYAACPLALSQLLTTIVLLALYWIGKLRAGRRFEPCHVNQTGDRTGPSGPAL